MTPSSLDRVASGKGKHEKANCLAVPSESDELDAIRTLIQHADAELAADGIPDDPLRLAEHFRRQHGPALTRMLCELHELRVRAESKFSLAGKMFFTRQGYEQSTSQIVAAYKAQRIPSGGSIVDLCCGVGGDAIALGKTGNELTLVDRSASNMELAKANLRVHQISTFSSVVDDVRNVDLGRYSVWHLDPDRRVNQQRRSSPNSCDPPLDQFLALAGRSHEGAIKLSPAAKAEYLLDEGVELEWIGSQRECQQQVAWFGALASSPGKRTATWLTQEAGGLRAAALIEEEAAAEPSVVAEIPTYLYEPRPSVLAAGLATSLAYRFGLSKLAGGISYLASDQRVQSDLFRRFETIETFPYRKKTLKDKIAQLGVCVTEVKKRGVSISPSELLRDHANQKDGESTVLILFSKNQSVQALLARRDDVLAS